MHRVQPLEIRADGGQVSFRYADLPPVQVKPFDPQADWRRAKSLRLYYWSAGPAYPRQLGLEELTFSRDR